MDPTANEIASLLKEHKWTVSIAESSSGGLISSRLLAIPGASEYFLGGSVVYTLASRRAFLDIPERAKELEPLSEPMAEVFAEAARDKLNATWGIAELGAAGPAGSRYGHAPGTSVIGVVGPISRTTTVSTGSDDRAANMEAFASVALDLFLATIRSGQEVP